ncbi:diguanylate cyclase [Photobacterium aphoticum]|uniref:Diguanylate cyclase n=1 Tax=Photobacterium aphoticum TaxID=754436 RepID=A0A090QPL2_9GAMM|nr:diguanylate cyclase [Photobacterium aphoticum]
MALVQNNNVYFDGLVISEIGLRVEKVLRTRQELEQYVTCLEDGSYCATYHNLLLKSAFQPIVTPSGELYAYEALMRMYTEDGELVNTGDMIRMYQNIEAHLINIDRLARVIHLRNFAEFFSDSKLFINMTPVAIIDSLRPAFKQSLLIPRILELGLSPDHIFIEILEHYCDDDINLVNAIRAMHQDGLQIAIDDYGSQGSSEIRTRAVMPGLIKIDQSLLQQYLDGQLTPMLDAIQVAREINAKVLIEGVENKRAFQTAIALGADLLQGYYTGHPKIVGQSDLPNIPSMSPEKLLLTES